ncbi:MAG: hypothetical protein M3Y73_11350 [Actinomycetota bacterium]|nr:hypothetical protein [Actinomycetota bacterium]
MLYRGQPVHVDITPHRLQLRLAPGTAAPIRIQIADQTITLRPGDVHNVTLPHHPVRARARSRAETTARDPTRWGDRW